MATGPLTTQVRAAHRALLPWIHEIGEADSWVRTAPTPLVRDKLTTALAFLLDELMPHTAVDEETVYPAVKRLVGAPGDTDALCRYHLEVMRLAGELRSMRDELSDPPTQGQRDLIAALLRGLHAIVALHIAKEERVYLPILDRGLGADEARRLVERREDMAIRLRSLVAA
jgi:iron-sulfur cluster repair protein YtfE (RIC family)